jgi:hypothetical protein
MAMTLNNWVIRLTFGQWAGVNLGMHRLRLRGSSALSRSGRHTYLPTAITGDTDVTVVPKSLYSGEITGPEPVVAGGDIIFGDLQPVLA